MKNTKSFSSYSCTSSSSSPCISSTLTPRHGLIYTCYPSTSYSLDACHEVVLKPPIILNSRVDKSFERCEFEMESPDLQVPEFTSTLEHFENPTSLAGNDFVEVDFGNQDQPKVLKIGSCLSDLERKLLVEFLEKNLDVFAWSYSDMPGLDPKIVEHRLILDPSFKPIKQKLRKIKPDLEMQVKENLEELLKAGFIRPIDSSSWLSNVVIVKKSNGKIRICVDFRDLNKATPKDDFPLPNIDLLVDGTAEHQMFSFMDGYSGYNQIRLSGPDQTKTAFITPWGTYCYTVMPFGLKNAGATYQRAMMSIFHDLIHVNLEVYVDDILVKSRSRVNHLEDLEKCFQRLRSYDLKLNPLKCVFGVESGKLLGFMVTHRGIEVDPSKIRAILDMPPPKTISQIRALQGRLQSIRRFISNLAMRCEPFNRLLRKDVPFVWDEECHKSFERLKTYLLSPPILRPPCLSRPLLLYLSVHDCSLGALLAQHEEDGRTEYAIYYLSKTLVRYERNYTLLEKTCLALVWATQKFRHYMLSCQVKIISRLDPIKFLLEKPVLSGRLSKWQVMLMEFDLVFHSQKSIKGQSIADHLADLPLCEGDLVCEDLPDEHVCALTTNGFWSLFFDGARNRCGAGIGILLISPEGSEIPLAFKLGFKSSNNVAEYEALTHGLRILWSLGVERANAFGDSMLVVNQVNGEWRTQHETLAKYVHLAQVIDHINASNDCKRRLAAAYAVNRKTINFVTEDDNEIPTKELDGGQNQMFSNKRKKL